MAGQRRQATGSETPASPRRRRIITAIANGCARASARPAAEAVSDYELLELVLFRAIPQRDVKPLAKELIAQASARSPRWWRRRARG